MIYAGVGSRETPPDILALMRQLGARFAHSRWTLRSGGAPGADQAFEDGWCQAVQQGARGKAQIYLPWETFGRGAPYYQHVQATTKQLVYVGGVTNDALHMAAKYHPAWAMLGRGPRALHGRNVYQVLGYDFEVPVQLVLCWTPDGATGTGEAPVTSRTGGTGQAIRIAAANHIPVLNLARARHRAAMETFLRDAHEALEASLTAL